MLALTIAACAAGVLTGLWRGGSLDRLSRLPIRLPWLVAIAWLAQAMLFASPLSATLDPWALPILLATMLAVAVVIFANRRSPGLGLLGLGLMLNALVVLSNGGAMPVAEAALLAVGRPETVQEMRAVGRVQKTALMGPDTAFWFLGDVLPFPPLRRVYSIGDLVAGVGVFVLVVTGMGGRAGRRSSQQPDGR